MSLEIALERIKEVKENKTTILNLTDLGLSEIPRELANLTHLTHLDLSKNNISEIKNLEGLSSLKDLELGYNKINEIQGLDNLNHLSRISLTTNEITEIKGLENLTRLHSLILSKNKISEIKGIKSLVNLKNLFLNINVIAEIKGLEKLIKLEVLFLTFNKISKIENLEKLIHIRHLSIGNNNIQKVEGLDTLKRLKLLLIPNNQISEISDYILNINLEFISSSVGNGIVLIGNPIINPPIEIVNQGDAAIREYFKQKEKGEEFLNEAKLILLGNGRSGKTSFANRLLDKELPKAEERTQGVDVIIGKYSFPIKNNATFKLNIWDFAGQDKYKTLHQLFYTESSLYVMVAESGNLTTDYDDWLQTAKLFGEGSPLILILNEFKEGIGMGSFDKDYWKKQFPNILKEVYTVNLGTKVNFSSAEEYLQLLAQTLPHTKHKFPSNWAAIRRVLSQRRDEQFITLKEYLEICKKNDLPERESALILSSVLHKIGDCLHYQKSELLNQLIILKNEWATDAVYKILDDRKVAEENRGFFDQEDLDRIWSSDEYVDMRPQLLELMKQFKLAYQLPGKKEYVTPPMLPPARPSSFMWPKEDSLKLYLEYDFLPKALLTQFIVSRHTDIADGRKLVWRNGVVLEWKNEALAEVRKTKIHGRDSIHVKTQGSNRKGMMTVILKTFRELHEEYRGIKYQEKVPCNCEGCKAGKNKQHFFDFENLKFRLSKSRFEVECDNSLKTLNVLELLENTFVFEAADEGITLSLKENIKREKDIGIKIVKLFLASSNELKDEREKIEQAIGRRNAILKKHGFEIDLLIWENGKHIGKSLRTQDNYNLEIEECNFFVMLFHSKVGKFTSEEFNAAKKLFNSTGSPRIKVHQKMADLPIDISKTDSDSRYKFLEDLREMEHFKDEYENKDELVNQIEGAIDRLLLDEDFVSSLEVENGKD